MALEGIDVSTYQGDVDWATVANQGILYAFAKATEGASSTDPSFLRNWTNMKTFGIVRGAYHFFRPAKDPIVQANNFLQLVKTIEASDLPPVLDLEVLDGLDARTVINNALKWISTIETATGRKPIVYTYPVFWEDKLGNPTQFSNYPLWIANFETRTPFVPSAWRSWAFHQYSESGQLQGIQGNVDLNQFNGTLDDLQKLLKGKVPLRVGSRGQVVTELQQLLKTKGFDSGTPDGAFGAKTKSAVVSYQQAKRLAPDGIVGAATWAALQSTSQPTPTPTPIPTPKPVPTPTPVPVGISLVNVAKSYRSLPHQDQALNWLQGQIPQEVIEAFAKRWRQM
ncbi:MAG: peptidoglycan-binding protein [Phormidesmis sp. CAN_BIN36]|nr:peptidoglycan-binding protein [Phormidesmis sp. CAN_BIN36]